MKTSKSSLAVSIAGLLAAAMLWPSTSRAAAIEGTTITGTVGCHVVCSDLFEITCNTSQVMFVFAGPNETAASVIVSAVKTLPAPAPGGPRDAVTQLIGPADSSEISFDRLAKGTLKVLVSMTSQSGALPVDYKLNAACGVLDDTNTFVEVAPPIIKLKQNE
jgi:hypothetical protein